MDALQTKKDTNRNLVLTLLFLVMTFFVFGPISFYLINRGEFWFRFSDVWPVCAVCVIIAFGLLSGLGFLLSKQWKERYTCAMFGLALGLYVQGNYVNTDYGTLDGTAIDWGSYGIVAVSNSLLWLICIFLPFVLKKHAAKAWAFVVKYIPACVVIMQLSTLVIYGIGSANQMENIIGAGYSLTTYAKNELSEEENTVVFVLDCYDAQYFSELISKYPELKEELFDNFVYYPDTVGGATRTVLALPYILTGQPYSSENGYVNYIRDSFASAPLYKALKEQNYNVGIYTDAIHVSPEMDDLVVNLAEDGKQVGSYPKLAQYLYKLTAFRYFPHVLKENFWMYTGDFDEAADWKSGDVSAYVIADAAFYQSIVLEKLTVQSECNAFRVYHLNGAHPPYALDANTEKAGRETSLEEQQLGVLNILREYFGQMKELGIYDDANIIVMADHGGENYDQNPLFMVKYGMETTEFTVSEQPVSYENLHPTLLKMLGADFEGEDVFSLTKEDNVQRLFYVQEESDVVEYLISGNAADAKNVSETGRRYTMLDKTMEAGYVLGTEVFFDARATGMPYAVSGFRGGETKHTWTLGNEAVLEIPLEKIPKKDLFVQITSYVQMTESPRVGIYVNDELLGWYRLIYPQLNFRIPKKMVDSNELKIRLELPDAISPADLDANSTDTSVLCIGIYSLVISEASRGDDEREAFADITKRGIDFSIEGNSEAHIINGWYDQEDSGRWSSEVAETVFVRAKGASDVLKISCLSFEHSGDTDVYINGHWIGTMINSGTMHTESFAIPETVYLDDEMQTMTFVTKEAKSPKDMGLSVDDRHLGIFVNRIEVVSE